MRSLLLLPNFNIKSILALKLKRIKNSIKKKKLLYWRYRRLSYYARRFSGRRRMRLNKFFFLRPSLKLYLLNKKSLLSAYFFFLNKNKWFYCNASKFLSAKTLHFAVNFFRRYVRLQKKTFFRNNKGHYFAIYRWLFTLLRNYTFVPRTCFYITNRSVPYSDSFFNKKRFRLKINKPLCFKQLNYPFVLKRLLSFSKLRKHRRFLRSLFSRLRIAGIKKIFFITLRSSKNNTMLSVFDFFGNLLYWKTSKMVGMSGKKRGTKMAAEFLAYHLTRYLRSRRFYSYKFIFTLFGLHRHFKVVFRFIKRNIRSKNVIAMLTRSRVPHGGCFIKKRKHKGRKKYRRRTSLYY